MPLMDHFHPPLYPQRTWEGLHGRWATAISDALNGGILPNGYYSESEVHWGSHVEIDVAAFEVEPLARPAVNPQGGVATLEAPASAKVWIAPEPEFHLPAFFPDGLEVLVYHPERSLKPVAAIELVSPGNKDRLEAREAFTAKCAAYLQRRMGLVILDVVTDRRGNLHNELLQHLHAPDERRMESELYVASYRPVKTKTAERIDVWPYSLSVGGVLPTVPLPLDDGLIVRVDLEATYHEACIRIRLPMA